MKLRDLFVSIGFDVDDSGLTELDRGLRKTKTLILAVGAAAVASAGMLYTMARSTANAGDKAAKTADKLGVQIEALQELRYAAELSGVAQNNFDTGLQRMTRRAAEAAKGTGVAKDAFKELGVVLTDSEGRVRRSEDLLADIAEGMAAIEDPSRRVALAFKLFDTEGVSMVNMLRNGKDALLAMRKEAQSLGFVIAEEDARSAEAFNDNLTRTKLIITGIRNEVGVKLLPIFSALMVQFREWFFINRHIIKSGVEKTLQGAIALLRWLYRTGRMVVAMLSDVAELFGGIERVAKAAAWAIGLFAGFQVLSAIGSLAMGLATLTRAISLMGNAALIANLKVAAIPVLIGAAVAALIVIWQDIISYFQGKDSVTGVIIDAFEKKFPRAFEAARTALSLFMDLVTGRWIVEWPSKIVSALTAALSAAKRAIEPYVAWLMEKIQPIVDAVDRVRGFISGARETIGDKVSGAIGAARQMVGLAPAGGSSITYYPVPKVNDVRVNAPVTVTVPEGTPPEAVGRAVQQGVSDGIARMLRDTSLATEPQVEY